MENEGAIDEIERVQCPDCGGNGLTECYACGTEGMEDCDTCDGSGEVEKESN